LTTGANMGHVYNLAGDMGGISYIAVRNVFSPQL
jgi:hypothetical protein